MTSVATKPAPSSNGAPEHKEKTAAVLFAGFMTLALGGAGLLIAALAVGAERAWSGGAGERTRSGERKRGWLSEQRAWLDADHKQRVAGSAAREAWLQSGADPATEPRRPSRAKRAGGGIRRLIAQLAVAGSDFKGGFKDGWKAAAETRKDGGGFRDVATSRPEAAPALVCSNCRRDGVPITSGGMCADCAHAYERPEPPVPNEGDSMPSTDEERKARAGDAEAEARHHESRNRQNLADKARADEKHKQLTDYANDSAAATAKGNTMSPTKTDPQWQASQQVAGQHQQHAAASASAGESNATVLRHKLGNTQQSLHTITELTDQLAKARDNLNSQVRDADEFATATGQSAQARTALDEANAVSAQMGQHLGSFSEGAVSAEEQVRQASDGLRVAENAEDQLRASGADGRAVAPAGAGA